MKLYFSPKAEYLYHALKGKSVPHAEQVKALLRDIQAHPQEGIGSPERVDASLEGYWERRFNASGMITYYQEDDYVVIISIMNELLPSFEELPSKLREMSFEDYAASIRLMEANRKHEDDPKVGIFWYNVAWHELFGVVARSLWGFSKANASEGRITCPEMHEAVWRKEYNRQKHHGDGNGPFIGPYENKPRGRVFYLIAEDRFVVSVGKWIEDYPDARSLILDEFDLPADRTSFEYAVHWDIGQTWR